jgi:hypothetical protein
VSNLSLTSAVDGDEWLRPDFISCNPGHEPEWESGWVPLSVWGVQKIFPHRDSIPC